MIDSAGQASPRKAAAHNKRLLYQTAADKQLLTS